MATKKEHPTPERCLCGRIPVAAKGKGTGWVVACPASLTCQHAPTSGRWPTLDKAVEEWNSAIRSLLYKEAKR